MSEKRKVEKGFVVFKEGDSGTAIDASFYKVVSGCVGIYRSHGTQYEKLLTERKAGDIFGEMAVIDYSTRSATAVALEDTELEVYTDKDFGELLNSDPDKMFEILHGMFERIRELTKDNEQVCSDIKLYAEAEGVNVEPSLLERILNIVKNRK